MRARIYFQGASIFKPSLPAPARVTVPRAVAQAFTPSLETSKITVAAAVATTCTVDLGASLYIQFPVRVVEVPSGIRLVTRPLLTNTFSLIFHSPYQIADQVCVLRWGFSPQWAVRLGRLSIVYCFTGTCDEEVNNNKTSTTSS